MSLLNPLSGMESRVRYSAYFFVIVGFFMPLGLKADVQLQPHRAYYTITMMGHPDLSSEVSDVRGTMMVEFNKVPKGWTVQQLSEIWRYRTDDSVEHIRWGYVTWEADDGVLFKFNTFRKVDGQLVEDIRGIAKRIGKLTKVIYQKPEKKTLQLPENVLFPVQHTKGFLQAAQMGEHMFPSIVFDGSNVEGAAEMNTFIGAKKVVAGNPMVENDHQCANQPFWPVHFTIYGPGEEPIYVTNQEILPNGIIKQYVIENDGIKIRGVLERIELLSSGGS